jgi:subtilisin family serine protease
LAALALVGPGVQSQGQIPSPHAEDEVLVQFARSTPLGRRAAILAAESGTELRQFDELDIHHVRLPRGRDVSQAVANLLRNPDVVAAQPNYIREAVGTAGPPPNDPLWLDGTLWGLQKIQAQAVWTGYSAGNGSVVIADIDTGVNYNHPDLAANMWHNPGEIPGNGIDDDFNGKVDDVYGIDTANNDSDPMDDHGHGSHTSGTFAGVGNNGLGVAGVNWNAKILACKFLASNGSGSDANAIGCFNYIVALRQHGINIRVANNSWGGLRGNGPPATTLKNAIDAAGAAGILSVFAAGNNNGTNIDTTPFDPASFTSPSIIAVAASDQSDARAGFSNVGVTSVDLAAPGVSITSTIGSDYSSLSGTSMATPHVSGAAALLSSLDPTLSMDSLKSVLINNVDHLAAWNGVVASGGRLNVLNAANALGLPSGSRVNVALASNGATIAASSTYNPSYPGSGANNGDRRGLSWGAGGGWNDATASAWPDWLEVTFNGTKTIDEVDVFSVQDNYASPADPTAAMTFTQYGLTDFEAQYWNGSAWLTIPGATVTGNNLVWRKFTFGALATSKIRVWMTGTLAGYSRIVEVEAYTPAAGNNPPSVSLTAPASGTTFTAPATVNLTASASDTDGTVASVAFYANGSLLGTDATNPYAFTWPNVAAGTYSLQAVATDSGGAASTSTSVSITVNPPAGRTNVALATNGGTVLASSTFSSAYPASGAINGDRKGLGWGTGGAWNDGTASSWPDWLEVDFAGTQTIDEVDVFTLQDNYAAPIDPTPATTFSQYGIRDFEVQYWNGTTWVTIPGTSVTANTLVWRKFTFGAVATPKIRVWITAALNGYSRVAEIEAYSVGGSANVPPTVTLTAPAGGTTYTAPATINFAATAADTDGSVAGVAFYANGSLVGTDTTNPYTFGWTPVSAGAYTLTAIATDNVGATTTSNAVNVTVNPAGGPLNVALASNGATASASSTFSGGYAATGTINGDRRGLNWGAGGGWNDATASTWPDWVQVDFSGSQSIGEVDVFTLQDAYSAPSDPTPAMTFSQFGIRDFEVQYWNGAAWVAIPGSTVTANTLVWRKFTFTPVTTTKIRVWVTAALSGYSRITEVEAYTPGTPVNSPPAVSITAPAGGSSYTAPAAINLTASASDTDGTVASVAFYANGSLLGTDGASPFAFNWTNAGAGSYSLTAIATDNGGATTTSAPVSVTVNSAASHINVALATNGGTVTASSTYGAGFQASAAIDGDRRGLNWGGGGGWNDATVSSWPDWIEVAFAASSTIGEVDVVTLQDNYSAPVDPTPALSFSQYGIQDFQIQYWNGSAWVAIPGGTFTGNSLVWRQVTFSPVTTTKIRVWVTAALAGYSRITEIEAYTSPAPTSPPPATPSSITLRADLIGTLGGGGNATSPIVAGAQLLLLNQTGTLYRWTGSAAQPILTAASAPAGVSPVGGESILNAAANPAGTSVFVVFTSSTVPAGVPQSVSPRPGADAWQVFYRYTFNGTALSSPQAIVALQVRSDGHTGGGMLALDTGPVLFATGDNGDAGEDGRQYAQDAGNHLSKILRIDPATGAVTVLASGVRNVQRLFLNPNNGDPRVEFADLGGAISEEINSVRLADLLASPVENFGWGRNAGDNRAREGTFYIDPAGAVTGAAPTPENGFTQPVAQFGREGAPLVGVTGIVSSTVSFTNISALFGDLPTGNVMGVTGVPGAANQTVYRVNLVNSSLAPVTLSGLAGGRPDPRFFVFPDGTAGVLLERTGSFYRLTQISQ